MGEISVPCEDSIFSEFFTTIIVCKGQTGSEVIEWRLPWVLIIMKQLHGKLSFHTAGIISDLK